MFGEAQETLRQNRGQNGAAAARSLSPRRKRASAARFAQRRERRPHGCGHAGRLRGRTSVSKICKIKFSRNLNLQFFGGLVLGCIETAAGYACLRVLRVSPGDLRVSCALSAGPSRGGSGGAKASSRSASTLPSSCVAWSAVAGSVGASEGGDLGSRGSGK